MLGLCFPGKDKIVDLCCSYSVVNNYQVARAELEAKASKSAGETVEEAKVAADAASAASKAAEGVVKQDHVQIDETSFLINLIDSPGHVDFSSEVCGSVAVKCLQG